MTMNLWSFLFLLLNVGSLNTTNSRSSVMVVQAQAQTSACSADETTLTLASCFSLHRISQALRIECLTCLSSVRNGCDATPVCAAYSLSSDDGSSSCPACANSPCVQEYKEFFNCRLQREGCPGFQCPEEEEDEPTTTTVAAPPPPPTSTSASTTTTATTTSATTVASVDPVTTSTTTTSVATTVPVPPVVPSTTTTTTTTSTTSAVAATAAPPPATITECSAADTTQALGFCLDQNNVSQNLRVECFSCLATFRQRHAISANANDCDAAMEAICPAFEACTACQQSSCMTHVQSFYECEIRRGDDCPNFQCAPVQVSPPDGGGVGIAGDESTPGPTRSPTLAPTLAPTPAPITTTTTTVTTTAASPVIEEQAPPPTPTGTLQCLIIGNSGCGVASNICCYPGFCISGSCRLDPNLSNNKDQLKSQYDDRATRANQGNRRRRRRLTTTQLRRRRVGDA